MDIHANKQEREGLVPKQALTRRRSWTARIAVLAVVFSLLAVALPASAHSVAISTSSSCPATTPNAGFTDIGAFGTDVQLAINCLVLYGISNGTTATTYSPNGTVLRWQMALFLVRQAADHGIPIPAATSQGFTDIAGLPQATQDAINQIAALNISRGTSTTTFSPNDPVTRWQMALFLRRLAGAAGVSVTDDPAHNQFSDIGAYSAEIQAAINFLADGHIALGVGGSVFDGNSPVLRWQMALFLTRVLAADGILPPAGFRVTVTPTDTITASGGSGRVYSATFKNADGTAYTGRVGVLLRIVSSAGVVDWDGAATAGTTCPDNTSFEAPTDGLAAGPAGPTCGPSIVGFPGSDGVISFTVRHDNSANAERVVPVAWEDADGDGLPEIVGNNAPTEFHGIGGQTAFTGLPLAECADNTGMAGAAVTVVDKTADRFEVAAVCSVFYDANDLFRIVGVGTDLAGFEAALNVGDLITGNYRNTPADQSTLDISTNNDPALTVTTPAAATTVDAATFAISGTAVGGYTVAIYVDNVANDGLRTAGEPKVGETTAAADGTWTIVVPLTQNAVNDFVATQRSAPAAADLGTGVQVPLITEGANTAALVAASAGTNGGGVGSLDVGDTVTVDFSEAVNAPAAGNGIDAQDGGGDTVRLTCGTNATCTLVDADTIRWTVTAAPTIVVAGDNSVLNAPGVIQALPGITGTDGLAINVAGSVAANKTFGGF
jgi:hypothetical protein